MQTSNDQSTTKLVPLVIPNKRPDSAESSLFLTKPAKIRDINERFRQEKTKAVNKRSAIKAKESGKRWSDASLHTKFSTASNYSSTMTGKFSFNLHNNHDEKTTIDQFYNSARLNKAKPPIPNKYNEGLNKSLFVKRPPSLNLTKRDFLFANDQRFSADGMPLINNRRLGLKTEHESSLLYNDKYYRQVYGFYKVQSNDSMESIELSYESSERLQKDKVPDSTKLKPFVKNDELQKQDIIPSNKAGKDTKLKEDMKKRYANHLKLSKLQKETQESVTNRKKELNQQRLRKIKDYGVQLREKLHQKLKK